MKSKYTTDGKYLAVITNNGLWIKDEIDNKVLIINSSEIKNNFLIDNFITEFDENYSVVRSYRSQRLMLVTKNGLYMMQKFIKNNYETKSLFKIKQTLIIKEFKLCIQI